MAKVSLRIYNREIESLIDQGRLDEAVAHCRHILQTFSKHLETYRLLGKAYLEAKRYEEAVDVFSRVLMAVPDDFVSHVGMSIIRDDQNQLDDAIWHMERAFEAQPSNAAIQSELQRLFGRRDGVEPPKIRMTRGALAHMYLQGELYHQAISEIKAVLAQDSARDDMKTLLARAYFHSGQRADASDICAQLLKRYPYAFDANRIMLELLQGSESAENTQVYRHRVNELDPYAAFAQGTVFRSNEVADAAVSLERLDYRETEAEPERDWRTAGISLGPTEAAKEPDWLRAELSAPAIEESEPVPPAAPEIPEFLREAGWVESSGRSEGPASFEPKAEAEDELAPAELPDWLQAMAPAEPEAPRAGAPASDSDWLADLRGESEAAAGTERPGLPDWLSALEAEDSEAAPSSREESLPDWLQPASAAAPISEAPAEEPLSEVPAAPPAEIHDVEPAFEAPLPPPAEIHAQESAFEAPVFPAAETPVEEPSIEAAAAAVELPVEEPFLGAPAAPPAEILSEEPTFEPPVAPSEEPVFEAPTSVASMPPTLETLGTSAKEQDDALAWLESLAAKHGAKAEELVTDPSMRSDKPPAWVQQARVLAEAQPDFEPLELEGTAEPAEPEFVEPVPDEPRAETPPADETGVWLRGLAERQEAVFVEEPPLSAQAQEAALEEEPPLAPEIPEAAVESTTDLADWLSKLDETPEETRTPEAITAPEAEPSREPSELPAWLSEAAEEETDREVVGSEPAVSMEAAAEETSDLPAWLRGLDEEQTWAAKPSASEELPTWLQSEAELPAEPEPTMPTDWHPVETTAEFGEETQPVQALTEEEMARVPAPSLEQPTPEMPAPSELEVEAGAEAPAPAEPAPETPAPFEAERHVEAELPEEIHAEPQVLSMEPELEEQPAMEQPAELPAEAEVEVQAGPEPIVEAEAEALPGSEMQGEELSVPPAVEPEPALEEPPAPQPAPTKAPAGPPAARRQTSTLAPIADPGLAIAHSELNRGNIPAAVEHYARLIRRGKFLEEIIRELREALDRYPVEVPIWQTLGDAYMRQNRLQEALDAYTKAEELLR